MSWTFCFVEFMDFLDENSKISGLQSGNRKFHCTETALLHYTDQLRKKMDEKHISVVVLLYMSNAFDSIQHDNLLSKLHLLGVSASALAWFKRVTYHYTSKWSGLAVTYRPIMPRAIYSTTSALDGN